MSTSGVASYDDLDFRFKNAHDRIQALQADFPNRLLARLPLAISDTDVNNLAVEEGWSDDFLRGGPLRAPPPPASGNIRNSFGNAVTAPAVPPKLPPVPRGVVASPAPVLPKALAAAPGIPVRGVPAATPEPAASVPAAPVVPPAPTALPAAPMPPPPVSGDALPVPETPAAVSKAGAPEPVDPALEEPFCVICQASMAPGTGEVRALECGHCYHAQCMDDWFEATSNYTVRCPLRCNLAAAIDPNAAAAAVAADVQIEATSFM